MADPTKFWDRIAEKYARQPVADEAAYQKKLEITRGYFTPYTEVLEVGCGTGSTAIAHAPYVKSVLAIDFSGKMIEIARRKAAEAGVSNVSFERATLDAVMARGVSLDAALCLSVLHLLADWRGAIETLAAMLKPGGVFVSSTTCLADDYGFIRPIAPIARLLGFFPRLSFFTQKALVAAMDEAGFAIDHVWKPGKGKAVFIVAKKKE